MSPPARSSTQCCGSPSAPPGPPSPAAGLAGELNVAAARSTSAMSCTP